MDHEAIGGSSENGPPLTSIRVLELAGNYCGRARVPQKLGLGIELDLKEVEKYRVN